MANTKQTSYIFPEAHDIILTAFDIEAVVGRKVNRQALSEMTPDQIYDIWLHQENEWNRYCHTDCCGKIKSYTFEMSVDEYTGETSCDCADKGEFVRFYKEPQTVYLNSVY